MSFVSIAAMITQTGTWRIAAIVFLALSVRIWGTSFGLPYDLTPDEPHQILQALKIGAGDGGPLVRMWHTVGKGGLDYLLFLEYGLLFCVWWIIGKVGSTNDFALAFLQDPSAFYLIGRWTVAVMGALTCLAVYGAGRRLYSPEVALIAALIGAFALDHATNSHLINVHIPMVFALWTGIWMYARFEQRPTHGRLAVAGVLAGLAVSLAYNAVVGLLLLIGAVATRTAPALTARMRMVSVAVLLASAFATILLMTPELVLDVGALLQNFRQLLGHPPPTAAAQDPRAAIDAVTILREQAWSDYLPILFGPRNLAVTVAAIAGIAIGIARGERWTWLLAGTTVLLVVLLSASDRGASERYLAPMVPALWLLAARGVIGLTGARVWIRTALILAVVGPSAFQIVLANYTLTRTDTRVLAKEWIESNIAPGARLLVDGMRFRYMQSPPLKPTAAALERQLAELQRSELDYPKRFLELYREAKTRLPGPGYDLHSTVYGLEVLDLDHYVEACFDYVVTSSMVAARYAEAPYRDLQPRAARFYDGIGSHPRFREVYSISAIPLERPGPTITVYAIAHECGQRPGSFPPAADP